MLWVAVILSFAVALVSVRLLAGRFSHLALDEPNARSLHARPVPRTGGAAVLVGVVLSMVVVGSQHWLPLVLAIGLASVSLLDDLRGMPTLVRLLAHAAASAALVWHVLSPMHPLEMLLLVLAVTWITNLYNFMDGSDGLAGGMAVIGFGAYAIAAHLAGEQGLAILCAALVAGAAAFLVFNFPPARIFLGDVGSIPLGFLAGALGLVGWRDDVWPLWYPVLVFGPFIGDATITLLKRLARRERVWQAHRDHYYQRLVRMGLGHRGTALIAYAVMAACGAVALSFRDEPALRQAVAFCASVAVLASIAAWVDLRWARHVRQTEKAA